MLFKLKNVTVLSALTMLLIRSCSTADQGKEIVNSTDQNIPTESNSEVQELTRKKQNMDKKYQKFIPTMTRFSNLMKDSGPEELFELINRAISKPHHFLDYSTLLFVLKDKYSSEDEVFGSKMKVLLKQAVEMKNRNAANAILDYEKDASEISAEDVLNCYSWSDTIVLRLLQAGASYDMSAFLDAVIKSKNEKGTEILQFLLSKSSNNILLVQTLIRNKDAINKKHIELITNRIIQDKAGKLSEALNLAFKNNLCDLVSGLLKKNVQPVVYDDGATLLHKACECASSVMVLVLLESRKFEVNAKDKRGFTPIQLVSKADADAQNEHGIENIIMLLIEKGADNESLIKALPDLMSKVSDGCLQSIYKKILESDKDNLPEALTLAVQNGLYELASKLLLNDVLPKKLDNGMTLLHLACKCADLETVKVLLNSGKFAVNAYTTNGISPIMLVTMNKMQGKDDDLCKIAELLIEKDAELDVTYGMKLPYQMVDSEMHEKLNELMIKHKPYDVEFGGIGSLSFFNNLGTLLYNQIWSDEVSEKKKRKAKYAHV